MKDLITILGGILGVIAFFWKLIESLMAHVTINVSIEPNSIGSKKKKFTVRLSVENTGRTPKKISYAALIISPESTPLTIVSGLICNHYSKKVSNNSHPYSNIYECRPAYTLLDESRDICIIPLKFFYEEQMQIGMEKLQYRSIVPEHFIKKQSTFIFRFIVYSSYSFGYVRWRTTSDSLIH